MARKRKAAKRSKKKEHIDVYAQKRREIVDALALHDVARLRQLGQDPGGFLSNSLRRKAWPLLLLHPAWNKVNKKGLKMAHKDEAQVLLDVKRSFSVYPKGIDAKKTQSLQRQLNHVIVDVLRTYPSLHYYQGFHDICTVLLLVYEGHQHVDQLASHIALFYLRDAMLESLEPVLHQLHLVDTLLQLEDDRVALHLQETGVLPFYCLSWVITWFSHDLDNLVAIERLFDLFLCSNPSMPLFVTAALVIYFRDDILCLDDASMMHHTLSRFPSREFDLEHVVAHALQMAQRWTPQDLQEKAAQPLARVSTINTFSTQWRVAQMDEFGQKWVDDACAILKLAPHERTPWTIEKPSTTVPWKQLVVTTTLSVGTIAIFMLSYYQQTK
ncbi:rab-GTPase-TBC domain-containing protein [Gongronella butleri]|nr:rab-GTPase-TBC domain-containing protein [Gongronella butleri]